MSRRDPFEPVTRPAGKRKREPFPFVLDELSSVDPWTRPMFGCLAVYVGERIVLILRDKGNGDPDDGVWVAFEQERYEALLRELPTLEPITVFGDKVSGWKKLAAASDAFEEAALRACAMIVEGDPRIGKIPGAKRKKAAAAKAPKAPKAPPRRASKPAARKRAPAKPKAKVRRKPTKP